MVAIVEVVEVVVEDVVVDMTVLVSLEVVDKIAKPAEFSTHS